ncbi:MAG: MFS transporter [Coprobacillaceae bacterium]
MENVKKLYMISFFYSLIPAYVIERLFWQERGMSISMVVYCEIIYALVITISEIPSGILADRFGRKKLLIIDCAFGVIEMVIIVFANEFWMFAVAVFFAGIGKSLSSGSKNALLYDSLVLSKKETDFEKFLGRITAIEFLGYLLAALSGSLLTNYFDFSFNYILSAGSMTIALLMTFLLKEPIIKTKQEQTMGIIDYTRQALTFFKSQPVVLMYCLTGVTLGASMIYVDEFWQLIMNDIGIGVAFFGIISGLQMVARIPGNIIAYKLKNKFQYRNLF